MLLLVILLLPRGGAAQETHVAQLRLREDVRLLAVNALIGGTVTAVASLFREASLSRAFTGGALGGMFSYAGKRAAAAPISGAHFFGRQVTAFGASIARNAHAGAPLLDTITFPVGPLRIDWSPKSFRSAHVRIDLYQTAWLTFGVLNTAMTLDIAHSIASGTPVFNTDRRIQHKGERVDGLVAGGSVILSTWYGEPDHVLLHEMIHVLQLDFLNIAFGHEIDKWMGRRLWGDGFFGQRLLIGVGYQTLSVPLYMIGGGRRLLETEATLFERLSYW